MRDLLMKSVRRHPVACAYVALIVVLAALTAAGASPWIGLVLAVALGPLAIAALLPLGILGPHLSGPGSSVVEGVLVEVVAVGLALLNARIAVGLRRSGRGRLLAALLFSSAGALFVVLCVIDGFTALTAHGVDVALPESHARPLLALAGSTFLVGLIAAVGGLVAWVVQWRRYRTAVAWAAADLALVSGSLATALVALSTA